MDLEMKIRKVERCLGVPVGIYRSTVTGKTVSVVCHDTELDEHPYFHAELGIHSKAEAELKRFHERIYKARCQAKYHLQNGKCAHCKRSLNGKGEANHIKHRGSHGRDDRMANLEIVCAAMSGGCTFHHDEHSKGKPRNRRTTA